MSLITFYLAPNARYQLRDLTGQPAQFGKLYTYKAGTLIPWPTYSDPAGNNENPNPVIFDAKGEANIYWKNNVGTPQLYYIRAYDATNHLIYDQDNYPTLIDTDVPPTPDEGDGHNFIRNPQFSWWNNGTVFNNYTSVTNATAAVDNHDFIADDWSFYRDNLNATINMSRVAFEYGQSVVPANPKYYWHYECNNIGAGGETQKYFFQTYQGAQTLAGEEVSIAFWAKSATSSTISISLIQSFGSGGSPSPSVITNVQTFPLTSNWAPYHATVTVPLVNGKNPGTDGNDALYLAFNMPLNAIGAVDLANGQMQQLGSPTPVFPYTTPNEQYLKLTSQISNAVFKTGDYRCSLRASDDPGWVPCNDQTIGNPHSNADLGAFLTQALFILIWNSVSNAYAPIFNSDGSYSTRGANAQADFDANKRLSLTKTLGRILATAGQAVLEMIFTANATTNQLTAANYDSLSLYTGTPVVVSNTGGDLPAPLAPATTYYAIYTGTPNFQLATTLANALANVPIDITTNGSGINLVTISYNNLDWAPGQLAGEYYHSLTPLENGPHNHTYTYVAEGPTPGLDSGAGESIAPATGTTSISGQGDPHNNLPPVLFMYTYLKL